MFERIKFFRKETIVNLGLRKMDRIVENQFTWFSFYLVITILESYAPAMNRT